jgi:hypothetical protein
MNIHFTRIIPVGVNAPRRHTEVLHVPNGEIIVEEELIENIPYFKVRLPGNDSSCDRCYHFVTAVHAITT